MGILMNTMFQSLDNSSSEADGSLFGKISLSPHWVAGTVGSHVELRLRLVKIKCSTAQCAAAGLYVR